MTRPIPISLTLPRGSGSVFTAGTQLHYRELEAIPARIAIPELMRPARLTAKAESWIRRSARDVEVVADLGDAAGHPGRADHRVMLGPGADVAGQRDRVPAGAHHHVAVIGDQRVAVQRVLDAQVTSTGSAS